MPNQENGPGHQIGIDDSFQDNSDSYNDLLSNNKTKVDVEDSGNNESYNDLLSHNKTKVDDSFNDDHSDNSDNWSHNKTKVEDSFNDDHSTHTKIEDSFNVSAGNREYKLDFGGGHGAAGGGAASVAFVDQSVNANVWAGDDVEIENESTAVQATGDGSWAAGDDIDYEVDASTNIGNGIFAGDDVEVNVGNTDNSVEIEDSFNWTDNSNHEKYDIEFNKSFNTDNSIEVEIEDSFQNEQEWKTITEFDTDIEDINIAGDDIIDIDVEDVTL